MLFKEEPIEHQEHGGVFESPKQDINRGSTERNEIMPSARAAPLIERHSRILTQLEIEAERKRKEIDAARLRERQRVEEEVQRERKRRDKQRIDEKLAARREARYREEELIKARWEGERNPRNGTRLSQASPPWGASASGSAYAASPDLYEAERSYPDDSRYERSADRSIHAGHSRQHTEDLDAVHIVKELQDAVRRMAQRVKEVELAEAAKEIELKDSENIQRELRKRVQVLELELEALREASRERFEAVEKRTDGIHDDSRALMDEVKQLKSLHASAGKTLVERDEHEYHRSSRYKGEERSGSVDGRSRHEASRSHPSAVSPVRTERGRENGADASSSRRSRGHDTRRDSPVEAWLPDQPRASKRHRASIDDAAVVTSNPKPALAPTIQWGEPVGLQAMPLQGGEEFTCIVRGIKALVTRRQQDKPQPIRFSELASLLLEHDPFLLDHFRVKSANELTPLCQRFCALDVRLSFKANGELDKGGEKVMLRDFDKPYTQCIVANVPSLSAQILDLRQKLEPGIAAKTAEIEAGQHASTSSLAGGTLALSHSDALSHPSAFYKLCEVLRKDTRTSDPSLPMKAVADELAVRTGPARFKETLRQAGGFYAFIDRAREFVDLERCGEDGKSIKLRHINEPFLDPATTYAYLQHTREWAAKQIPILDEHGQSMEEGRIPTPPETDQAPKLSPVLGTMKGKTLRRNSDGELSFGTASEAGESGTRSKW